MTKYKPESKTETLRGFENCRVMEIGVGSFAECAQWGPIRCSHALLLGGRSLCLHPHVDDIIENTKKALLAEKQ